MNYCDTIDQLRSYSLKRFPDPEKDWAEDKIRKRSFEQTFSEFIILNCLEDPTRDPIEVVFDSAMYYEYILGELESTSKMVDAFECASRTSYILLSFLRTI